MPVVRFGFALLLAIVWTQTSVAQGSGVAQVPSLAAQNFASNPLWLNPVDSFEIALEKIALSGSWQYETALGALTARQLGLLQRNTKKLLMRYRSGENLSVGEMFLACGYDPRVQKVTTGVDVIALVAVLSVYAVAATALCEYLAYKSTSEFSWRDVHSCAPFVHYFQRPPMTDAPQKQK